MRHIVRTLKVAALAVIATAVSAGIALYANQQGPKDDQKAMDAMKAYKTSMEAGNPAAFSAHLALDFKGFMPTGRPPGKYTVNLYGTTLFDKPKAGHAHSFGTTKETLVTPSGKKEFVSVWYAYSRKAGQAKPKGGK